MDLEVWPSDEFPDAAHKLIGGHPNELCGFGA